MHIPCSYLRCEDVILFVLYTNLPITTTIAGKWLLQLMDRQRLIAEIKPFSENEVNFLQLRYKQSIILSPGSTTT